MYVEDQLAAPGTVVSVVADGYLGRMAIRGTVA
jgi:hypothetical protein